MKFGLQTIELESMPPFQKLCQKSTRKFWSMVTGSEKHLQFTGLLTQHEPDLMSCILVSVPNLKDARDIFPFVCSPASPPVIVSSLPT